MATVRELCDKLVGILGLPLSHPGLPLFSGEALTRARRGGPVVDCLETRDGLLASRIRALDPRGG